MKGVGEKEREQDVHAQPDNSGRVGIRRLLIDKVQLPAALRRAHGSEPAIHKLEEIR